MLLRHASQKILSLTRRPSLPPRKKENRDKTRVYVVDPNGQQLQAWNITAGGLVHFRNLELDAAKLYSPNSCYAKNGVVFAAAGGVAENVTFSGKVWAFDEDDYSVIDIVSTGALPDHVSCTWDGSRCLTANEGEPNAANTVNPAGGFTIFKPSDGNWKAGPYDACTVVFSDLADAPLAAAGLHQSQASTTIRYDIEPEYIAYNAAGDRAFVALQEANAIMVVDISNSAMATCTAAGTIKSVAPLGLKDWSLAGNEADFSDKDADGQFKNYQGVFSMYQPDTIVTFEYMGETYVVTANEGDSKDPEEYGSNTQDDGDEFRVKDLPGTGGYFHPYFDPYATNASIVDQDNLGRMKALWNEGREADGGYIKLVGLGGRSISIWKINDTDTEQIWDSGDILDKAVFSMLPGRYDGGREDDKGSEPEGLALGRIGGRQFVFVGLERMWSIAVFDISDPFAPTFHGVYDAKDTGMAAMDRPEGLVFVGSADSPDGKDWVIASGEDSQDLTWFTAEMVSLAPSAAPTAAPSSPPTTSAAGQRTLSRFAVVVAGLVGIVRLA